MKGIRNSWIAAAVLAATLWAAPGLRGADLRRASPRRRRSPKSAWRRRGRATSGSAGSTAGTATPTPGFRGAGPFRRTATKSGSPGTGAITTPTATTGWTGTGDERASHFCPRCRARARRALDRGMRAARRRPASSTSRRGRPSPCPRWSSCRPVPSTSGCPAITAGTERPTSGSREPGSGRRTPTRSGSRATGPSTRTAGTGSRAAGSRRPSTVPGAAARPHRCGQSSVRIMSVRSSSCGRPPVCSATAPRIASRRAGAPEPPWLFSTALEAVEAEELVLGDWPPR